MRFMQIIGLSLALASPAVLANCGVNGARIVDIHQYYDGHVFINFDKATNCNCEQKERMAFSSKDADMEFLQSLVLVAYTMGKTVNVYASSENCSVHGNTPKLNYVRIPRQ